MTAGVLKALNCIFFVVMPVLVALQLQLAACAPTFFNDSRKLLLLLSDNTARISFVSNITPFLVDFCNALLLLLFCIYQIQFNPSEWMEKEGLAYRGSIAAQPHFSIRWITFGPPPYSLSALLSGEWSFWNPLASVSTHNLMLPEVWLG